MNLGIILETKEPEKAWNAFRFANQALVKEHKVKMFLMGEAVECENINNPQFNVVKEMRKFNDASGILLACGTCLTARMMDNYTTCNISTMNDCVELVEWADKVVTF